MVTTSVGGQVTEWNPNREYSAYASHTFAAIRLYLDLAQGCGYSALVASFANSTQCLMAAKIANLPYNIRGFMCSSGGGVCQSY